MPQSPRRGPARPAQNAADLGAAAPQAVPAPRPCLAHTGPEPPLPIASSVHSALHSLTHSITYSLTYSLILLMCLLTHLLIHSSFHSSIHPSSFHPSQSSSFPDFSAASFTHQVSIGAYSALCTVASCPPRPLATPVACSCPHSLLQCAALAAVSRPDLRQALEGAWWSPGGCGAGRVSARPPSLPPPSSGPGQSPPLPHLHGGRRRPLPAEGPSLPQPGGAARLLPGQLEADPEPAAAAVRGPGGPHPAGPSAVGV